jgi:aerobic carbon-monoxide dehydrogenase medium subunit
MIPAAFEYERAESVDHAIELLGGLGDDAKLLAGGHSLIPLMKLRLAAPTALVDIGRVSELSYVREDGDAIAIGALTRLHDVHHDPKLMQDCPMVSTVAGMIGDPQVRHRGTIGGTAAHADPASDYPAVLVALSAQMVVRGPNGERRVDAADFFKGLFQPDLAPTEVLTEIRVPKTGAGWSYQKFHRRAIDWAVVGVAALAWPSNGGIESRIVLTNVGDRPVRAQAMEQALASGSDPATAAADAARDTSPPSDHFASAEYRREMVKVIARRAVEEALSR